MQSLLLYPGSWWAQDSVFALQGSVSPVLCKFCQPYAGVSGDLLQESLCHSRLCCTQSPCFFGKPLLTCAFTGDTQTQFCLHLCGVSGSWCSQGLFEPSEHLWWVRGLILNATVLLGLLLCPWRWGIFFGGIQHSPVNGCSSASCSSRVEECELAFSCENSKITICC